MNLAIIDNCPSINIEAQLKYIPDTIISGSSLGVDNCVKEFSLKHNLSFIEFFPDYDKYSPHEAQLKRDEKIIDACDCMLAIWDGKDGELKNIIDLAILNDKPVKVVMCRLNQIPYGTIRLTICHNLESNADAMYGCTKLATLSSAKLEWIENQIYDEPTELNPYGKLVSADVVGDFNSIELAKDIISIFGSDCSILVNTFSDINEVGQDKRTYIIKSIEPSVCGILFYSGITNDYKLRIEAILHKNGFDNVSFNSSKDRFNVEFNYTLLFPEDLRLALLAEELPSFKIFPDTEDYFYRLDEPQRTYRIISTRKENWDFSGDDSSLDSRFW